MSTQSLTSELFEFDSASDAIEHYFRVGWTDGLPVVPPTTEKVGEMLDYVGRSPSEILGTEPTKGRVITVEKVAINAVMAGCLPEYFPVVLAAVEALCEPQFNLHAITVSTMGAAVLAVVSGPVADDLAMNSSVSVFGPGHRANATIGRAIRLVIINVTGALPGVLDKATLGHPGKYTWCIAEAEQVSPWEPLHEERGLAAGTSAITLFAGLSATQVPNHTGNTPETILVSFRDAMFAAGYGQGELVVVLCPEHVGYLGVAGWSKADVKRFLHENAQRTVAEWQSAGREMPDGLDADAVLATADSPDSITLLVAGGFAGAFSQVIPLWGGGSNSRSVCRQIELP
ncbi:MAG: hypothetical protein OXI16_12860 [Chloroflexota bacterium]|nr:hypothetical protein [Chloroflexota bacterium]